MSQVEQLTTDLKQFVESHTNNVSLFPWEVGKRLDLISNAYGKNGSGQFTQFMENLTDNIGLAKTSGYNYLDRYRQAVALFPEAVSYDTFNLLNYFLNFNYDKRLQFRFGRFKTPYTYEFYKINVWQLYAPERSIYNVNFALNRQVGAMFWGELFDNRWSTRSAHSTGGGTRTSPTRATPAPWIVVTSLAVRSRSPVVLSSVGLGPIDSV